MNSMNAIGVRASVMSVLSAGTAGVAPAWGLGRWLSDALRRIQCYRRLRQERNQLLALGDRDLHDIGISRVDAIRIANRSTWDVCRHPAPHDLDLRSPQL